MTSESQMDLESYYDNLPKPTPPKTDFVKRVAEKCKVGEGTVRLWIRGVSAPSNPEYIAVLVEETGIPAENLFVK